MALRDQPLAQAYYRFLQTTVLPWARRRRLRPDQLTVIGVLIACAVPLGFILHPMAGFLLILLSGSADAVDGLLAREKASATPWGAFLDSSLDRLSDGCYLLGFWILFWQAGHPLLGVVLLWPALIATLMISYVKARAEALGGDCAVGLMERAARIVLLCAWALCLALMPAIRTLLLCAGALLYLALTATTVVQRILHVRRGG
ncbi:MAG: CDP-alcohol phosphatidyltransferase family protein [Desulfosarcinaceae bacterium]|nr:CDP-alcohol phosphatidyltransferase family protein [Desulfosarcinaceae bacterium]